jgi:opacity protein-like surface antigen
MRAAAFIVLIVLTCVVPAAAQSAPGGYIQGLAGAANVAGTDVVFGGAAAVRARDRLDVFVELGHLRNGIWEALDEELASAESGIRQQIEALFGTITPVSFEARVPIWYGLGGARVRGPRVGAFGTYVEAGVGMARLRPRVRLEINGERLDTEARRLLALEDARAEMLTAVGAGISLIIARRIRVEGGYRYSRVHGEFPVDINRVHAGAGYAF